MSEILYEGVRFSDGSCAVRRIDPDPCERATRTFESVRELNEELDRQEVIRWLADATEAKLPPAYRISLVANCDVCRREFVPEEPYEKQCSVGCYTKAQSR